MQRSHALLLSTQFGLGRTSIVRFAAHLSKMKYFEPRTSHSKEKSEEYLKSILRQCCLLSGIKGSHVVIYIKMEYFSPKLIEALCAFARTGIFPDLFSEEEICQIANQIIPSISALKRTERTIYAFNTFVKSVQERLHLIISLESCQNPTKLITLFRTHSTICNDFYIDVYKPLKIDSIQAVARSFLTEKISENRNNGFDKLATNSFRELNELEEASEDSEDYLDLKDIDSYSSIVANLHSIAYNSYLKIYFNNSKIQRSKPFSLQVLKQVYSLYYVYMKRIYQAEKIKFDKYSEVFKKLEHVRNEIKKYGDEILKLKDHLVELDKRLNTWDNTITKQKNSYKVAVDECKKEEKLVEEMGIALDQLKAKSSKETQDLNKLLNPQYEAALRALNSLSEIMIAELRSYRAPPQRVLAVVNTLCLMFQQEPNWEAGKLLLLRNNFYEELVYFDKAHIPDETYFKLEKIVGQETFKPDEVRPGSEAAASLCEWIIAVFEYCTTARAISSREREIREYEELYKTRQTKLGEKRIYAEKERDILESFCRERVNVLKEINQTQKRIENINEARSTAEYLLKLLDNDAKTWMDKAAQTKHIMQTYKTDAIVCASYMVYAGIFDSEHRERLLEKWLKYFKSTDLSASKIKFFNTEVPDQNLKYTVRNDFNIRDILIQIDDDNRETWLQIENLANNDKQLINNAIILSELCTNVSSVWPVLYDPENYSLKILTMLQNDINVVKEAYVKEILTLWSIDESKRQELSRLVSEDANETQHVISRRTSTTSIQPNESASRSASRTSRKSIVTRTSERSSMWETSTFLSRALTNTSNYFTRSGKVFLPKYEEDIEPPYPHIETELQSMPKDNLWIVDSLDESLDYKIVNGLAHGITIYLRNSEQRQYSRIVEKVINRDFIVDALGHESIKIADEQVRIHPGFKLILHVNTPPHVQTAKNNYLYQRLFHHNSSSSSSIDFTPSFNFITTDLLNTILDFEKPGYLNQCFLAEKMYNESQNDIKNREAS
jgi:dynein heavy chain